MSPNPRRVPNRLAQAAGPLLISIGCADVHRCHGSVEAPRIVVRSLVAHGHEKWLMSSPTKCSPPTSTDLSVWTGSRVPAQAWRPPCVQPPPTDERAPSLECFRNRDCCHVPLQTSYSS